MDVYLFCFYFVLSCAGRGICDELITRPEESYRVSVCVWSRNPERGPMFLWEPKGKMSELIFAWRNCGKSQIHSQDSWSAIHDLNLRDTNLSVTTFLQVCVLWRVILNCLKKRVFKICCVSIWLRDQPNHWLLLRR
jgi:hypothetical protein